MSHAVGTFEVKVKQEPLSEVAAETGLGRMTLDKIFSGQLEATSQGEMLSAMGIVKGSAGYVAMERVTGILEGRTGTFALMHTGVMTRGTPELKVVVVPDSGTADLTGLTGTMQIDIVEGVHHYEFHYNL